MNVKEEVNINEVVKIERMAIIKNQLDQVEKIIDEKVENIPETIKKIKKMSFVEQEEEKKDIKKYQHYLSNLQKQLEDKRKELKKEINKPYEEFNEYYSNGVYLKLNNGIQQIKEVVNEIETLQKDEKELEIKEFAEEHIKSNDIQDIIKYEDIGLNITLSASISSLKEQILTFIDKIVNDLKLIELEEYKDEIMVEYKQSLDFVNSKMTVVNRHKQLEEIKARQEELVQKKEQEQKVIEKVEEVVENIMPPIEIETTTLSDDEKEILTVQFTVKGTKSQLKELKEFLNNGGYVYE